MGISIPSFFKERKFPFVFTLLLPLACITIFLFTNTTTNAPYPLFIYSDLQTSPFSSQPISLPAPSNPAGESSQGDEVIWEEPTFPVSGIPNWNLCISPMVVDYIPCLDNSKAIKALKLRHYMEHHEQHCPQSPLRCLEPLLKGYKVPIPWPQSRDMVRFVLW